jgi:hypothetical protein
MRETTPAQTKLDGTASLDAALETLKPLIDRWDYRRVEALAGRPDHDAARHTGAARWGVGDSGLSQADEARVLECAKALGLCDARPPRRCSVDCVLILGGARLSVARQP